ncbi:PREDICTED: uncharacterized protein LOC108368141 [Rhagoletis zephyria]|uniref:uncharacterized protein LOC108368141 n=1 Tax=Rhagoletis zephyria TaxID=28612 RepID=UPI00081180FA|nr:PREDICTED: uncharacterized protein LOC108368141 [Rhagoletis zephyria]
MLTGADDLQSLLMIKREVCEVLNSAQLSLTKWFCNHPSLMESATDIKNVCLDDNTTTSALGISWYTSDDVFGFAYHPKNQTTSITKRSILSTTSSLFDPLGLISPVIIKAKILLQRLWVLQCDWDESVPQTIASAWEAIRQDLQQLHLIRIPRYVGLGNAVDIQVHGFGDASTKAYGCCLYVRCKDEVGNVTVNLLASKSRVAPLKVRTLPRLELCAAHLLVKFWNKIEEHLNWQISQRYFWSDSQITLHWIQSQSSTLSTFVGNRVSDVQQLTKDVIWRHIPTEENPSDHISRGFSVNELVESNWLHGPPFLLHDSSTWPSTFSGYLSDKDHDLEKRKLACTCEVTEIPYLLQRLHQISSYIKGLRVVAIMLRFRTMNRHLRRMPYTATRRSS